MNLTQEMKNKIDEILSQKEFLRTGKKVIDGETYRLTDGFLLLQCIKDNEAELGRMVVEQFSKE